MGEATMLPEEVSEKHVPLNVGMKLASKYIADQMLEQRHLKVLHKTLSTAWNRNGQTQSLSAAFALMQQYGVELTEEEVQRITAMEEDQQIAALVNRMPQESNEQFQQFFLQLQLLVSTAMRVRDGLEEGTPNKVESALDDADSTGVTQHILRMAIVQAGNEAAMQRQEYEGWVRETDEQMGRLIRGQEDAMAAQKKLATMQARLQHDRDEHAEKACKVCMSFVTNITNSTKLACFQGWISWTKRAKQEGAIVREYEEQLEDISRRLAGYRQASLANVRSYLDKKAQARTAELLAEVLNLWYDVFTEERENEAMSCQVEEMNSKMAAAQGAQKETTKRVVERMSVNRDVSLVLHMVQGWRREVDESKKDGLHAETLANAQARLRAFLQGKNEGALKFLKMALGGSDTAVVTEAWVSWKQTTLDVKREAEVKKAAEEAAKLKQEYREQHIKVARSAMNRAAAVHEQNLLIEMFENWRVDSRVEHTAVKYGAKIDAKRQQLAGVHQMFREFAHQLEGSLKKSLDSDRQDRQPLRRTRTLHKMETGTVSLPDIHKPPTPTEKIKADIPQPKMAWG
mmetsp:Transcript_133791/g.317051  ORF Transcript_133791/g.317051 Transcript_133791/m.317051 type:complete len:572 (-) Transcript_133791:177-1892(-)